MKKNDHQGGMVVQTHVPGKSDRGNHAGPSFPCKDIQEQWKEEHRQQRIQELNLQCCPGGDYTIGEKKSDDYSRHEKHRILTSPFDMDEHL